MPRHWLTLIAIDESKLSAAREHSQCSLCCHCPNAVVVGRPTVTRAVSHADTAPDAACTGLAGRTHEAVALCEGPRSRSSRRSSCSTVTAIQSELALPPALGQSISLHVRAGSTRAAVTRAASVPSTDVHMPDRFWAVVGASPSFGVLIKGQAQISFRKWSLGPTSGGWLLATVVKWVVDYRRRANPSAPESFKGESRLTCRSKMPPLPRRAPTDTPASRSPQVKLSRVVVNVLRTILQVAVGALENKVDPPAVLSGLDVSGITSWQDNLGTVVEALIGAAGFEHSSDGSKLWRRGHPSEVLSRCSRPITQHRRPKGERPTAIGAIDPAEVQHDSAGSAPSSGSAARQRAAQAARPGMPHAALELVAPNASDKITLGSTWGNTPQAAVASYPLVS